eukprot:TRINITY_DN15232_c0_g1_i1.p1 TRINITY_DN15232_c0_g1~~TRINITY_DN15232_c0_g1_i1.p1  ORF type:complete len:396 (+),score=70.22 TRINITY_DN15232_c0_g1_i1:46-1188(+)
MASFDGKILILSAILIYCVVSMGMWNGKRSTCSGRGRINGKGTCDCQERFEGTSCSLCQFGRYGSGCYFGSPAKGRLVDKIRIVFVIAPHTTDYSRTRLHALCSELLKDLYVASCTVLQYPPRPKKDNNTNNNQLIDSSTNFIIVADYSDGVVDLLEDYKRDHSDVTIITWILSNSVSLDLWRELRPNAHTSPSEGVLKNVSSGKLEPVRIIPEPALECEVKGSSSRDHISIFYDFDSDIQTVSEEVTGFGKVRFEGSGWGDDVHQKHERDLRLSFSSTQLLFYPNTFSDVVPVAAFDAASCGAVYIPLPTDPHSALRWIVPSAVFPENLLDLRIQIQSLLQHPNRVTKLAEEFTASTNIANTLKEVASQLVNTYEVLLR